MTIAVRVMWTGGHVLKVQLSCQLLELHSRKLWPIVTANFVRNSKVGKRWPQLLDNQGTCCGG